MSSGGGGGKGADTYPDVEVEVLVFYRLDVEAYRGYRRDNLADLLCVSATPPGVLRGNVP